MKKTTMVAISVTCVAVIALLSVVYMWFHGYFDPGKFEVKQMQWSPSKQVAVIAERSDQQALGGLTYFVLVGDHLFTPIELKHAYHSSAVVFAATSTRLTLHWNGPNTLVVACNGSYLGQEYIDVEKQQSGEVTITYVNISPNTAQTYRPK
jgi:hypothetical protein